MKDLPQERLNGIELNLTPEEIAKLRKALGREPSVCELVLFDIMWSEHCSYKSSRKVLRRYLPAHSSRVVIGPGEDAGVVRLARWNGRSFVLVVAHESHNHPSQILPVEGAATGIGGIVRDVYCMGADVIGVMDSLRFGDPFGENAEQVKEIVNGVIRGIWEYANALGVPNLGGDVFFDRRYDENCLVNVIAIGIAEEQEIIRSRVPPAARDEPYDYIIVGKPTDRSGLGGATLASRIIEGGVERNVGAVQIHDPFLKRVLTEATKAVLTFLRKSGVEIGFKDLGAGGIACAISEMASAGGFGAEVDLREVHVADKAIEPYAIACSETQERYCFVVPSRVSEQVLRIYNEDYELPHIYRGARASVVGRVTSDRQLVMRWNGTKVVDVPVDLVTQGITVERRAKPRPSAASQAPGLRIQDYNQVVLTLLGDMRIASRRYVYTHYDSEVKGNAVIRPGEADAGVFCIPGTSIGIAASVDGNPIYCSLDPYTGAIHAVCESVRNITCVGAQPIALTDCLNFGNPENQHVFWDFEETVKGIGDAARKLHPNGTDEPIPVVSGNVSFYNESSNGSAIPPSPIVACFGVIDDYSRAITLTYKQPGNAIVLIGRRRAGLGGSVLLSVLGEQVGELPRIDLDLQRREIDCVREAIENGLVLSCHDISEGGLACALAEMIVGGWGHGMCGAEINLECQAGLSLEELLFAECGPFIVEVNPDVTDKLSSICSRYGVDFSILGRTIESCRLVINYKGSEIINLDGDRMRTAWMDSLGGAIN